MTNAGCNSCTLFCINYMADSSFLLQQSYQWHTITSADVIVGITHTLALIITCPRKIQTFIFKLYIKMYYYIRLFHQPRPICCHLTHF